MVERRLIVDQLKLSYEGLFDASELYALIDSWFYEKNWDKEEKMNQEILTADGKQIKLILQPYKNISDYFKLIIKLKGNFVDVKDVEVEKEGQIVRLNHGTVMFTFDGYVLTDRFGKWQSTPFLWFLRIIFDKYLFKQEFNRAERWLQSDLEDLHGRIKSFLNVYNYKYATHLEE